jgi:hypothetical protein
MDALSPAVSVRSVATTAVVWASRALPEPKGLLGALAQGGLAVIEVAGPYAALAELTRLERLRHHEQRHGGKLVPPSALVLVYPDQLPDALSLLNAVERYAPAVKCWLFGPSANPRLRPIVEEDRVNAFRPAAIVPSSIHTDQRPTPQVHVRPTNLQTTVQQDVASIAGRENRAGQSVAHANARSTGAPNLRLTGLDRGGVSEARFQSQSASADREGEVIGPSPSPAEGSNGANRPRHLLSNDELRMLLEEPGT